MTVVKVALPDAPAHRLLESDSALMGTLGVPALTAPTSAGITGNSVNTSHREDGSLSQAPIPAHPPLIPKVDTSVIIFKIIRAHKIRPTAPAASF